MVNNQLDYASKHILVVDDKEFLRTVLSDIFRAVGYHVHNYSDGEAALTFLTHRHFKVDLMIIDQHVPYIPCSKVVEEVRRVKDKSELPIMVMTSTYKHRDEIFLYKKLKVNYFLYSCTPLEDIFFIAKHLVFSKEIESTEQTKPTITCPVDFKVNGNWQHAEAVNLTPQGIFIKSKDFPNINSPIELNLKLSNNFPIHCQGIVVRLFDHNYKPHMYDYSGFGVLIEKLNPTDAEKIKHFIDERVKKTGGGSIPSLPH